MKERLAGVLYGLFSIIALLFILFGAWLSVENKLTLYPLLVCTLVASIPYAIGWAIRYIITGNKDSFIVEKVRNLFSKNTLSLFVLANLPIYDLLNHTEPFDNLESRTNLSQDENLNTVFLAGVLSYQFFIYLEIIKNRFGVELSKAVEEHMYIALDRSDDENERLGGAFKSNISLARVFYEKERTTVEVDGKKVTFPEDYDVAMGFLYYMDGSPYRVENSNSDEFPEIKDDFDMKFMRLLEEARIKTGERYIPILLNKHKTLDDSFSSLGLRIEDRLAA